MKIVHYPHPALRHEAKPVSTIDKKLRLQIGDMFELMYAANGLGLAATQVALPIQLLIFNPPGEGERSETEQVFINPTIVARKGIVDDEEGCLSFPGMFARVKRAKSIIIEAYDLAGRKQRIEATDLLARMWQHEIDHLNGVLFIDKFSAMTRLARSRDIKSFENVFRKAQASGEIPPDVEIERMLHALEHEMA